MPWTPSIYALVVLGSAGLAIAVGLVALRRRPDPLAGPLAVMMFAVAAWAVPHAISLGYDTVAQLAFWHQLRYPGTVVAPVAFLVLSMEYAGYDRWRTRRVYAALGVVPAITVALVWTASWHGLYWQGLAAGTVGNATVLVPTYGPWYWVTVGYLYSVTLLGLALVGEVGLRSGPVYRKQAGIIFLGGVVPLLTNLAMQARLGPDPMVDLTTTALAATGLSVALAVFHFDLLEVRPIARDRLVEALEDGVVVVGPNGRIRDFNPTAERILDGIAVDQPAGEVLPEDVAPDGGELVVETDEGRRRFRSRSTPLTDGRGEDVGRIVYLNDVTDIVEREQRISVLNRVLRHNIRNELNLVQGHLTSLDTDEGQDRHVDAALEATDRIVGFAEKARHVERTLQESAPTTVAVAPVVESVVADTAAEHPSASITVAPGGTGADAGDTEDAAGPFVEVVDRELLELAVVELVENAVAHSDRDAPTVTVDVSATDEAVTIAVADDGPGLPDQEVASLTARTEGSVEHSDGLGLWLVRWTTSLSGGTVSVGANEPRGTVVSLRLPRGDPVRPHPE